MPDSRCAKIYISEKFCKTSCKKLISQVLKLQMFTTVRADLQRKRKRSKHPTGEELALHGSFQELSQWH